jgi:hypothetical protein
MISGCSAVCASILTDNAGVQCLIAVLSCVLQICVLAIPCAVTCLLRS